MQSIHNTIYSRKFIEHFIMQLLKIVMLGTVCLAGKFNRLRYFRRFHARGAVANQVEANGMKLTERLGSSVDKAVRHDYYYRKLEEMKKDKRQVGPLKSVAAGTNPDQFNKWFNRYLSHRSTERSDRIFN